MKKKVIIIGLILAVVLGGGLFYRSNHLAGHDTEIAAEKTAGKDTDKAENKDKDKEEEPK